MFDKFKNIDFYLEYNKKIFGQTLAKASVTKMLISIHFPLSSLLSFFYVSCRDWVGTASLPELPDAAVSCPLV